MIGDNIVIGAGSANRGRGNVIAAAAGDTGVLISGGSTGTRIAGNYIGTNRSGSTPLGNGDGIRILSAGGNAVGPFNTIRFNDGDGVQVAAGGGGPADHNRISANEIDDNGLLGIHLLGGANGGLAPPSLTSATRQAGATTVTGTFTGAPGTDYFVEFFVSAACDGSGVGEGRTYDFFEIAHTDAGGHASFSHVTATPTLGQAVTATATSAVTSDTSAFSSCATVIAGTGTVTIPPEADTYVASGAPTTNFGTLGVADVYGGIGAHGCVLATGTSYTLMRFDLSSIPAGASISDVELETTTRAGYAVDGDPAHWALFVPNDGWSETGVTWNTRPSDGLPRREPCLRGRIGHPAVVTLVRSSRRLPLRLRSRSRTEGDQAKTFPSTADGFPMTVAQAKANLAARVTTERAGDGKLSLELWTPNCRCAQPGRTWRTGRATTRGRPRAQPSGRASS